MSQWADRFQQHQLFREIQALFEALTEAGAKLEDSPVAGAAYARLHQINLHLRKALTSVDPVLVSITVLNNLASYLASETAEVRQFIANTNVGHLENANSHADSVLTQLPLLLVPREAGEVEGITSAVSNLREQASRQVQRLEAEAATLRQTLSELSGRIKEAATEIDSQKGVLSTSLTQYQQQFLQAEESRRTQFTQTEQARSDQALAVDTTRKDQFTKAAEDQREAFRQLLDEARKTRDDITGELRRSSEEILTALRSGRAEAEKLVGIIGDTGVVSGYKRVADEAHKLGLRWNLTATAAMVGLIVFAGIAFLPSLKGEFSWGAFAGRVFVSLTFGVLGYFAAYQGMKHTEVERRNRRLELELTSIGPFISQLQEAEQREVKRQLIDRLFGQQETPPSEGASVPTGTMLDAIKLILQNLPKK